MSNRKEYRKRYYQEHKIEEDARNKKYYDEHTDQIKTKVKEWGQTPEGKKSRKKVHKKYENTPTGKRNIRKSQRESKKTPTGRITQKKSAAKRKRDLGWVPLLSYNSETHVGHHIDDTHVVGIPKPIHESLSGTHDKEKHRSDVMDWLKENNLGLYKFVKNFLNLFSEK